MSRSTVAEHLRAWAHRHMTKENGRRITQGLVDSYTRTAGPRWAERCLKGLREQGFEVASGDRRPRAGWATAFALGAGLGLFAGAVLGTTASSIGGLHRRPQAPTANASSPSTVTGSTAEADAELLAHVRQLLEEARRESQSDGR